MDQSNYSLMTPMLHRLHNNNTGEGVRGNAGRISCLAQLFTGTRFRNRSWAATDTVKTCEGWGIMGNETPPSCLTCTASPKSCKVKWQTQEVVWLCLIEYNAVFDCVSSNLWDKMYFSLRKNFRNAWHKHLIQKADLYCCSATQTIKCSSVIKIIAYTKTLFM